MIAAGRGLGVTATSIKTRLPVCFKHLKQTARHLRNLLEHLGKLTTGLRKLNKFLKIKVLTPEKDKYLYVKGNTGIVHFLAYQ